MSRGFAFKQCVVNQERAAMKVGTDGVLLGAWADILTDNTILDVGTGTGLIALMVAQRNPEAKITAIEPQEGAWMDAKENFAASPWRDRLRLCRQAMQQFVEQEDGYYDHIVCNPPFFNDSLRCPDYGRSVARHSDTLDFDDLIACSARLLRDNGRLSLIIPTDRYNDLMRSAGAVFHLSRCTEVMTKKSAVSKRMLIELS